MKYWLLIWICFSAILAQSQTPVILQDSAYVFAETGHAVGGLIFVEDSNPISLLFTRNSVQSQNSSGIILVAGPDSPDADTNNVDNGVISGNLFKHTRRDGGAHGILAGYNINYKIKHNKILGTPYNIVIEGTAPMAYDSGGVYYNIIDVGEYYGVTVEGQDSLCIYNNTFFNSNSNMQGYPLHFSFNIEASPKAYTYGAKVKNNIFYSTSDPYMIFVDSVLHASGTFECDYNLYWCEEGNNEPRFYIQGDGGGELSWAEWQALGYDANSVVVNPNFINTIDFIPAARLNYGTELSPEYQTGLAATAAWIAGTYPDTYRQDDNWQVGAVLNEFQTSVKNPNRYDDLVTLYPNPNKGSFKLNLTDPLQKDGEVSILSSDGKVVYLETMFEKEVIKQFELPSIKPGLYMCLLSKGGEIHCCRFIKE